MKSKISLIIFSFLMIIVLFSCDNESVDLIGDWEKASIMRDGPRSGSSVFIIDNKAYIIGGIGKTSNGTQYFDQVLVFDPSIGEKGSWSYDTLNDFPGGGRYYGVAFAVNGKGYYGCGRNKDDFFNDFYEFDPNANPRWTRIEDYPSTAMVNGLAFSVGNYGYVGTGFTESGQYTNAFYKFDPTLGDWIDLLPLFTPVQRSGASCFIIKDKVYIMGGIDRGGIVQEFECFDPNNQNNDYWKILGYLSSKSNKSVKGYNNGDLARSYSTAFTFSDKGYVTLGFGKNNLVTTTWQFDPLTDKWTEVTAFEAKPRYFPLSFTINNKCFIGLGDNGGKSIESYYDDFWSFDPYAIYVENPSN
jgi:N-acetylneuraminic acid mutarotase